METEYMNIIRYAIKKEELHTLLRSIGILQPKERLLSVNNLDLHSDASEVVIVTVVAEAERPLPKLMEQYTEEELRRRFVEMTMLEDVVTRELRLIVDEMQSLRKEYEQRKLDVRSEEDGIPGSVAQHIREQLRNLLSPDADPSKDGQ